MLVIYRIVSFVRKKFNTPKFQIVINFFMICDVDFKNSIGAYISLIYEIGYDVKFTKSILCKKIVEKIPYEIY